MSSRIQVVPGNVFDGGVTEVIPVAVPTRDKAAEPPAANPYTVLRELFEDGYFNDKPEESREFQQILGLELSFAKRLTALFEKVWPAYQQELLEQSENANAAVRAKTKNGEELDAKIADYSVTEWNKWQGRVGQAQANNNQCIQDRSNLSPYVSRKDVAAADERVWQSELELKRAQKGLSEIRAELQSLGVRKQQHDRELNNLKTAAQKIMAKIAGRRFINEKGIYDPPKR